MTDPTVKPGHDSGPMRIIQQYRKENVGYPSDWTLIKPGDRIRIPECVPEVDDSERLLVRFSPVREVRSIEFFHGGVSLYVTFGDTADRPGEPCGQLVYTTWMPAPFLIES